MRVSRHAPSGRTWRRVGLAVSLAVAAAAVLALGLVLTGIIAEPETLLVDIMRWILGK